MRGEPDSDIRHQRGSPGCTFLDDVQHVSPRHHREVRAFTHLIGEPGNERPTQPGQGLLPRIPASELECAGSQTPPLLLREVNHETVLFQRCQQVIHR